MDKPEFNPRLRVSPVPVEVQGKRMLIFQDPEGFTEETVLMPLEAAAIVQFFDGSRSVREIQEELMRQSGQLIDTDLIQEVVNQLDERLLLESPRFYAHVKKLNDEWERETVRPSSHAGLSYPDQPDELKKFLDSFYTAPDGPGGLPGPARPLGLKAIVAPHMDLRDSGPVCAFAYKRLAEETDADTFVIFGTGHNEPQRLFVMSDKDYATPLGVAPADRELIDRTRRLMSDRNPPRDYVHKDEHSIEFAVLLLQHALAGRPIKIVPVLCSGAAANVAVRDPQGNDPAFKDFIGGLAAALSELGRKSCFIASADLAHLGPRYGDKEHWAPIRMAEEEKIDRDMLAPVLTGDRDGFFNAIAAIGDRRRICGLPPIYATMAASGATQASMLKWSYWHDRDTQSVVTFAAMSLY